jgi:hypothetical protein
VPDQEDIERRADYLIRELDEFMVMAGNKATYPLIEREHLALGQVKTRIDLLLSFIATHQPSKLRIISRG